MWECDTTIIWLFIHWHQMAELTDIVTGMDDKAYTCYTVFPSTFFRSLGFLFMWMEALLLFNVKLLWFPLLVSNVNVKNYCFFSIWIEGGDKLISEWLIRGNSHSTEWFHIKEILFFSSFYEIYSKNSPLNSYHLSKYSRALGHS